MDKKSLLIAIALLTGLSALAQSAVSEAAPESITGFPHDAWYNRPAGAFYSHITAVNGVAEYNSVSNEYIMLKPYSDYTFHAMADNIGPETQFQWQCINEYGMVYNESYTRDLTVNNEVCWQQTPTLSVRNGGSSSDYSWYNPSNGMLPVICPIMMLTAVNPWQVSGQDDKIEYLLSSKSPAPHGRNDEGLFYSFDGLMPYGSNGQGWWLGKNASHVDGIAQAFEKPTHPYLLKKVCLMINNDAVITGDVTLTCKVYRLNEIPAYEAQESVRLPEVPGELIALGKGTVTPGTVTEKNGLVEFSLYRVDQANTVSAQECQLTVDEPILVVIDGYNEPEAAHLMDFTARASTNIMSDEGYGELAYVKCPVEDSEGDFSGDYEWRGLNHLLYNGMTMMTGLSIYIVAEHPYLQFLIAGDGEYEFGAKGGMLRRQYGNQIIDGIKFLAWTPSESGEWTMVCNGEEELPDWLDIELVDNKLQGEFNHTVTAQVTAEPLPVWLDSREAVVRFGFPGAYLDYKFIQQRAPGDYVDPDDPPIVIIHKLIEILIYGKPTIEGMKHYDINQDGELTIADVDACIKIHFHPEEE